jgi:hypothetical protein
MPCVFFGPVGFLGEDDAVQTGSVKRLVKEILET